MNKYRAIKTTYNGFLYDSKKEAAYAMTLDMLKKAKNDRDRVVSFKNQIPFICEVNGKKVCKYIADFEVIYADGRVEIIDVKGMKTSIYNLKKKLVEALHDIKIIEV